MVLIKILDHVQKCYSNDDGKVIYNLIKNNLSKGNTVTVSFIGLTSLNSSFVNSAFIELLNDFDFNFIRSNLTFIDSTKQINGILKDRFSFEINRKKKLVSA